MAKNIEIEKFATIDAFVKSLNTRELNPAFKNKGEISSKIKGNKDFYKTDTYEESEELLTGGYREGLSVIQSEKRVNNYGSIKRNIPTVDVVGFAPHVPNAIAGIPQSMVSVKARNQKSKIVSIIYNNSADSSTTISQLATAGRHVLDVVAILERQGYRVNVDILTTTCTATQVAMCFVHVKDALRAINPLKLAYILVHPSFFRRQGLRWIETCPKITDETFSDGYGYPLIWLANKKNESEREWMKRHGLLPDGVFFTCYKEAVKNNAEELIDIMGLGKKK